MITHRKISSSYPRIGRDRKHLHSPRHDSPDIYVACPAFSALRVHEAVFSPFVESDKMQANGMGDDLSATVHPCRKRRLGKQSWSPTRSTECTSNSVANVRATQRLDGDTRPAIRKDSLCKGHHGMIGERWIRIGTHLRARVDMVAADDRGVPMSFVF